MKNYNKRTFIIATVAFGLLPIPSFIASLEKFASYLKLLFFLVNLSIFSVVAAQISSPIAELPQKVIISSGHCNSTCGYNNGCHDITFNQELEYSLTDSTFRFRNKTNKSFKKLEIKPSAFFTESSTYKSLDSLYENFTDFKMNRGKYYIYKVELIYCKDKMGLPLKTKVLEFLVTTNPEKLHPLFIDKLIEEYKCVVFKL